MQHGVVGLVGRVVVLREGAVVVERHGAHPHADRLVALLVEEGVVVLRRLVLLMGEAGVVAVVGVQVAVEAHPLVILKCLGGGQREGAAAVRQCPR